MIQTRYYLLQKGEKFAKIMLNNTDAYRLSWIRSFILLLFSNIPLQRTKKDFEIIVKRNER